MRLENSFYRVVSSVQTEDGYDVTVTLEKGHPIYAGHFPGQPVVPGMCTLTIVRECLASLLGKELMFSAVRDCKFMSALVPDKELELLIHLAIDGTTLNCVVEKDSDPVFKLKASYSFL